MLATLPTNSDRRTLEQCARRRRPRASCIVHARAEPRVTCQSRTGRVSVSVTCRALAQVPPCRGAAHKGRFEGAAVVADGIGRRAVARPPARRHR